MTDKPMTATAMMQRDMETDRLSRRDRALAMSIASEMVEKYFEPAGIEDMRDVRRQIINAAEHAAYEAIQKEREFHAGDMSALRKWSEAKWAEAMMTPPAQAIEAQRAETERLGRNDESAVGETDAPESQGNPQGGSDG